MSVYRSLLIFNIYSISSAPLKTLTMVPTMQIHPSVIMNVSEHHTRVRAVRQQPEIVIGALLGKKSDANIEVVDSFELRCTKAPYDDDNRTFIIDREFYQKKIPLVRQVSPELDLIGWYSTIPQIEGPTTREGDISLHRQISEFIPNPIFLKLNPYKRESDPKISGALPITIYEPVIEINPSGENLNFIEVNWTIVTEDVEIIGLEHNSKMTPIDVNPSTAIDNLRLQHSAVKMLKERIRLITKYVKDVQAGKLPYHEEPLNNIAKLTKRFPLLNSGNYARAHNTECNDVALNTYLGILTKGTICKMHFGAPNLKTRALSTTHARR